MDQISHPPPDSRVCARWGKECRFCQIAVCKKFKVRLRNQEGQGFYPTRCKACFKSYGIVLQPYDLRPQFQKRTSHQEGSDERVQAIETKNIGFEHFTEIVQEKIRSCGKATFFPKDGRNSKVIFPPKDKSRH